jgi:hypothetical protein
MRSTVRKGSLQLHLAAAGISLLSIVALQAGDPIKISEPVRKRELPKAGPKLEELSRSYDFLDSSKIGGPASAFQAPLTPSPNGNSTATLKKLEELIDHKKNWIFETSKDTSKNSSTFGSEEDNSSTASSNPFERRSSTVMENFFNERDRNSKQDSPNDDSRRGNPAFDPGASLFRPRNERSSSDSPGSDSGAGPNMEFNISNYFQKDRGVLDSERRMNNPLEIRSSFAQQADNSKNEKKLQRERDEEARQAEFSRLLQPRSLTPTVGGSFDILNRSVDPTRQEANPIAPRTFASPLLGTVQPSSSLPSASASSSRSQLNGPSVAETMNFRSAVVNPLQSSSVAPAPSAPSFSPAPFVLDIQRRKF